MRRRARFVVRKYSDVFVSPGGWPSRALQYARDFGVPDGWFHMHVFNFLVVCKNLFLFAGTKYKYANSQQMCVKKFPQIMKVNKTCELHLNGDESQMMALVAQQPVVVGFEATINFMYYKTGIFSDPSCTNEINHAVVALGRF